MNQIAIFFLLLISFTKLNAQSTEEIIGKHIKAIGGAANWEKIKTIIIEETLVRDDVTFEIQKSVVKNKALRNDFTIVDRAQNSNDKKYYVIVNGDKGWKYLPDNENFAVMTLEPSEVIEMKDNLDFEDPFIHYEEKGREISMLNIEYFNEQEFYKFSIKNKAGKEYYCYVNTTTFLIDRTVLIGGDVEDVKIYSDYQKLPEGVLIAKKIETTSGEISITSIKINKPIADFVFTPTESNHIFYKK